MILIDMHKCNISFLNHTHYYKNFAWKHMPQIYKIKQMIKRKHIENNNTLKYFLFNFSKLVFRQH